MRSCTLFVYEALMHIVMLFEFSDAWTPGQESKLTLDLPLICHQDMDLK